MKSFQDVQTGQFNVLAWEIRAANRKLRRSFYLIIEEDGEPRTFFPTTDRVTIGRSAQADITLNDEYASALHAEITFRGAGAEVRDLGSTNGLLLNDVRVSSELLRPRDIIAVGRSTIQLCIYSLEVSEIAAARRVNDAMRDASRSERTLSVLFIERDGSTVLSSLDERLAQTLHDYLKGADELVTVATGIYVLLWDTDLVGAHAVARKLRGVLGRAYEVSCRCACAAPNARVEGSGLFDLKALNLAGVGEGRSKYKDMVMKNDPEKPAAYVSPIMRLVAWAVSPVCRVLDRLVERRSSRPAVTSS